MLDTRNAPVNVYLSAGSNMAPAENLRMACSSLESEFGELTLSSVYQNPAEGFAGDDFLNMVVGFRPDIAAYTQKNINRVFMMTIKHKHLVLRLLLPIWNW